MVKSRKMNSLKYYIIVSILLNSFNCLSQNLSDPKPMDFYVVDTITINNPVVFYKSNQSGKFISDIKVINGEQCNLKKVILKENVYIFGRDFYWFANDSYLMEKYHYPDYGNCEFKADYFKNIKGIVYRKFKKEPKKFVLALINVAYYNDMATAYGENESVFKKYDKPLYYKIVFPLCE